MKEFNDIKLNNIYCVSSGLENSTLALFEDLGTHAVRREIVFREREDMFADSDEWM